MTNFYTEIAATIVQSNQFKEAYLKILKLQRFGITEEVIISETDVKMMLECAAIFAFASDEFKQRAYKIAVILAEKLADKYDNIQLVAQYIMIISGQLPVVRKSINDGASDYFSIYGESSIPFNPILFHEVLKKQNMNSVPVKFEGGQVYLTDFQSNTFQDLMAGKSVSISAPTSAGKSFLLKAYLSKQFKDKDKFNVVYLVPTRALIGQVQRDFKAGLRDFGIIDVQVSSSPPNENTKSMAKKLFVLTQERFHTLLFDTEFKEPLNVLIIDEAQKVSDASRGLLLEEVIEEALKRNQSIQKIFLSPFSKNPEKFAQMFKLTDLSSEKTRLSPVSQNLLKLNVKGNQFSLILSSPDLALEAPLSSGMVDDDFDKLQGDPLLWSAKKFGADCNIVFCNSPALSLENALLFSRLLPEVNDPQIQAAINFLKEHVHPKYYLIDCLKKGIAYHSGKMPTQIRELVEDLFRSRKIKFVFCTSTLLEGVNLPAQNIFIHKPKIGRASIDRLSFWNLAGRAGRLLKDYYGNIFCINVDEWTGYQPNPSDVEHEIESILESILINKHAEIFNYLKDIYHDLKDKDRHIEQAITKFIIKELKEGKTEFVKYLLDRNPRIDANTLQAIKEQISQISRTIEIPAEIIQKNSSIDPRKQQELLSKFRSESLPAPLHPADTKFYSSLLAIYKFINEFFLDKTDKTYSYYTLLTNSWLNGKTLSELIQFKIKGLNEITEPTAEMVNNSIERLFTDLNDKIMFEFQKYLRCYIDLLLLHCKQSGFDTSKICDSLPFYIEFGTYQKNVLILQSAGINRATSVALSKLTSGQFSNEADALEWIRKNIKIIQQKLSPFLLSEIKDLT